ncbi:YegS/Rv2252/BmrU family lipid kinase [Dyadobacter jejuensis]|uniref:YegS/Rv2252/BmrU family lipid kinase n=1 Tax=Dyadobacter jejuensis TaxID=1082580 RepID=A0A316AR09_9BACT|nr:diacylglycerol kinase family protein [Dyadobacter jejuensis]PWJ59230.1 YegS/Rv2252/BmrU family lipid kinase [Dyadobacter jejuensis]
MHPERKILLVVNPVSGGTAKDEIFNIAIARSKIEPFELLIYQTTGVEDLEAIGHLVSTQQPERVIVAGGDGTIGMVARTLAQTEAIMGIIPAGSANGLSVDFALPTSFEEAFDIALGSHVIAMDAVDINGDICLHLGDIGLNALLVKNYEMNDSRGKIGYAKEMLKTLSEHNNFRVQIDYPEGRLETEALIVIIANGAKYGTGVNINPKGSISDGFFELVIARRLNFIESAKILTGSTDFDPDILQIVSTKSAHLVCPDHGVHFQIDGEYKGEVKELRIEIIEKYVHVAVPAPHP